MKTSIKLLVLIFSAILLIALGIRLFLYQNQRLFEKDDSQESDTENELSEDVTVIADNLSIPWDIAFLPTGEMLVTERDGNLFVFNGSEERMKVEDVEHVGEGGLLGMALHPDFSSNRFVYLYQTSRSESGIINHVVRYTFKDNTLSDSRTIIDNIPGVATHDGGRLRFGPDGYLYITTGDAENARLSQDPNSLVGKILRLTDNGRIPADNPFGNAVWSLGHQNPQGITWDDKGNMWATEHGPSGFDEINLIFAGGNYGWPAWKANQPNETDAPIFGDEVIMPISSSGSDRSQTWAPASALYLDGSIFFGGLAGNALYEAVLDGEKVLEIKEHFKGEFGRIRSVVLGPDNMIYISTSNRDGRGRPETDDDKVIKINPHTF